jgi:ATP-dependent RNA helicase DDX60
MGHFPITTTLVARLLQIVVATERDSDYARKAIRGLLEQSRISLGSEHSHQEVLHHFRFSIEYLLRQNLINSSGNGVALAGLTSHLYYTEPANFALAELLRQGVFHRICHDFDSAKPDSRIPEAMVHVLAHIFGRRHIKKADLETMEAVIKRSSSKVVLDPLPQDALEALRNHNAKVVEIYRAYAISFARASFTTNECHLPLSELSHSPVSDSGSALIKGIQSSAIPYGARSSFVATSGHGDSFDTVADIAHNTRDGILVEDSAVPSMDRYINPPILNAYLLDFYKHGGVDALVTGNGISRGDVWFVLDAFDRVLAAIDESLKLVANGVSLDFAGNALERFGKAKDAELAWEGEGGDGEEEVADAMTPGDRKVCQAFSFLRSDFNTKFKKMWA